MNVKTVVTIHTTWFKNKKLHILSMLCIYMFHMILVINSIKWLVFVKGMKHAL
jgi:hypothetical protein